MQYKNDLKLLATDHVLAITAVLGQPRTPGGPSARDVFRCAALPRASGLGLPAGAGGSWGAAACSCSPTASPGKGVWQKLGQAGS